jgi:hypothetical protein
MSHLSTTDKIKFLQKHIRKWHERWHKKHPENIVGFRIGKKTTNGVTSRYYSLIFQVKKKKKDSQLDATLIIPKFFTVKFPDGKKRKIRTDVEQTGVFKFQLGITSEVDSIHSDDFGTAGLFVTDNSNRVFMLTNYHVVAERMIQDGKFFYKRPASQVRNDVRILTNPSAPITGRFEEGLVSKDIDAAFVELFMPPDPRMNLLPDQNRIRGVVSVRPYPRSFIGKSLLVYSFFNRNGRQATINNNSAIVHTANPNIFFEDVLQITPKITRGGDSGGIVVTPSFAVLGIIVGADNNFTYAIPYFKIDDFKNIFVI